ncbi:ankyrin repeat domain-containing protein [Wolbachia endosymbiont of Chironomus riparius]|uniref:ankyrin repeat domain-containing protein n=1 Tax=Wolbachia endosymbiont of Chironomus riparius TaxID=2883238 RepID=UPI0020A0CF4B|nr:ankyrin repeat domain-containing protein [Wolbachia endosymbiont of Chironomus riparius]
MRNILYFLLLITAFSIFAIEESERAPKKENNINELQSQVDTIESKQGPEQNSPEQIKNSTVDNQVQNVEEDKEADYMSTYDFILDKWPALKALDEEDKSTDGTYDEKHHFFTNDEITGEKTHSNIKVEKVINQDDEINKAPEEYNGPTEGKLPALKALDEEDNRINEEVHSNIKVEKIINQDDEINKAPEEYNRKIEDNLKALNQEDNRINEEMHSNIKVEKVINQDDEINKAPEEYNGPTEGKLPALKALDEEDNRINEEVHSNIKVEKVINQDDEINKAPEEYNGPIEDKLKALNEEDKRTNGTYDEEHKVSTIEETSNQNNKATKKFEGHSEDKISDLSILNKNNNGIFSHSNKNQFSTEVTESMQDNKNLVEGDFSFDNMKNDRKYSLQTDSKSKGINKNDLLGNKENVEITNQAGEKKEEITESKFKKQRQEKYIVKRDEDESKDEKKKQQNLTSKKPIIEWIHKSTPSRLIYKRQYDSLNEHLPTTVFINDYSKQLFYCIKKNNLSCLRGVLSKLEKIGLSIEEALKWRNKLGDTPLIYASKCGNIDIVRFLLLQNSDSRAVNYNFQSAMDVAIEGKQIDIINAITEMIPRLIEHKTIDNEKDSIMYNWAIKTKDRNKSKYDAAD